VGRDRRTNHTAGWRGTQSDFFKQAYDAYDAEDRFKYANNELEQDANDRAAYIIEGFREADLRLS